MLHKYWNKDVKITRKSEELRYCLHSPPSEHNSEIHKLWYGI